MKSTLAAGLARAALLAGLVAPQALAEPPRTTAQAVSIASPVRTSAPGVAGVTATAGDVVLAGQPDAAALERFVRDGVKLVINLRTPEEMARLSASGFDEAAEASRLGVRYVTIPVASMAEARSNARVDALTEALKGADGKVLLHCASARRVSHMWAAWLVRERGLSPEAALIEAGAVNLGGAADAALKHELAAIAASR